MKFLYYSLLIVASIDIFISGCYLVLKDWPRAGYLFAAAILTGITLLMK